VVPPVTRAGPPLLLSERAAAATLGVSRDALSQLRRAGRIRVVPWLGRWKIPLREVERLAAEGVTPTGRRPRAKRPATVQQTGPEVAAAIRAIKIEGCR